MPITGVEMSTVSWVLAANVKPGQLESLRALMEEMVESTEKEPGTLAYEWFISEDENSFHLYERYVDSEAALAHLSAFGDQFAARFTDAIDPTGFHVYGDPTEPARKALSRMGAEFLATWGGFAR